MLHTDIWKSKQVSGLSIQARLLYIGLITLGDDDGRLNGDAALLRSQIFPRDEKVSIADVSKWLEEIVSAGLIVKYTANGDDYLAHPNWTRYQTLRADRRKDSNIPSPPADVMATIEQPLVNQESAKDKVSKEKEGKLNAQQIANAFDAFWKAYPNKTAKKKAEQIYIRLLKDAKDPALLVGEISIGLMRANQSPQWKKDGGQFIPHPSTWLNQERWNDEGRAGNSGTKVHRI